LSCLSCFCKKKNNTKNQAVEETVSEDPLVALDKKLDKASYFALAKVPYDPFDGYHSRLLMRIYTILKGQDEIINK
jgi:hypothetical protein